MGEALQYILHHNTYLGYIDETEAFYDADRHNHPNTYRYPYPAAIPFTSTYLSSNRYTYSTGTSSSNRHFDSDRDTGQHEGGVIYSLFNLSPNFQTFYSSPNYSIIEKCTLQSLILQTESLFLDNHLWVTELEETRR